MTLENIKKQISMVQSMDELTILLNSIADSCCKKCTEREGYEDSCACNNRLCLATIEEVDKIKIYENDNGYIYLENGNYKVHLNPKNRSTDYAFNTKEEAFRFLEN